VCVHVTSYFKCHLKVVWPVKTTAPEVPEGFSGPSLSAIVQARRLSLFSHIVRMPEETDARSIITASPSENWRRGGDHQDVLVVHG